MTEWAKSHARAQHWVHEVRLVDAEMQRVIDFNESMAKIWDARKDCEVTIDLAEEQSWASDDAWVDGMRAYASKQAYVRRAQAAKWSKEFTVLRLEAKRFLTVHTDDGLTLDPSTVLPAAEIEDMVCRTAKRRERRTKAKRVQDANAAERDPADDDPFEGDTEQDDVLDPTTPDSVGDAQSTKTKKKPVVARSRATNGHPRGARRKRRAKMREA